jgi:hypothetical protein
VKSSRPDADPAARAFAPRLSRGDLLYVALFSIIACTPWPMGKRIPSDTVGLIGEWRDSLQQNSPELRVLRFRDNGRSELVHLKTDGPRVTEDTVWTSRWELHQGHGPDSSTTVVCFNVRRARAWPLCKSVHIDSVNDRSGTPRKRLTLEGWIGDSDLTKEIWFR